MRRLGRAIETRFGFQANAATVASAHSIVDVYSVDGAPDPATIEEPLLGAALANARDTQDGSAAMPEPAPALTVPLDLNTAGLWLKALFGNPNTTGSAPDYRHEFSSGGDTLPYTTLQTRFASGDVVRHLGCVANSMQLRFTKVMQFARLDLGFLARRKTNETAFASGTAARLPALPVAQCRGYASFDGVTLGDALSCELNFSNNCERYATLSGDEFPVEIDPMLSAAGGTITIRHRDATLAGISAARTRANFSVYFVDPVSPLTRSLQLTFFHARLVLQGRSVQGPNGIDATYAIEASQSASNPMVFAVLNTGTASY